MKQCYYELSRRQILVVWTNDGERDTATYPRTEAGQRRANAKLARLQADGYTFGEAPKDWYTTLIDEVRRDQHSLTAAVAAVTYPAFARYTAAVEALELPDIVIDLGAQLADELAAHIA